MMAPKVANTVQIDYRAQWEQERAKNQQLREENAGHARAT
ncbi:hypothetical protein MBSD_n2499 [Mizugakiibacter sediminis]|uniref:Uncharacterized protein n=1 Tax=Mizugakiibacter sediminis TaxID=1475481 RepID=A0A0K8QQL7_9GAMM|nr:hypothetical protein MBSD_n2499 [Mizugakiibacter sediminis]